jgi:iron uptake system component EfeO
MAAAGCGAHPHRPAGPTATAAAQVEVSISHCGAGWAPATAGHQQLTLHNTDTRPGEVLLTDAGTGAVYSYLEPLAAGSTADVSVDLGPGKYRFRCAMEDEDLVNGPVVSIGGHATITTPAVAAVTQADLIPAAKKYQHYVGGQLPTLSRQVTTLASALAAGRLDEAKHDWLLGHLEYERLGAAYGAFGTLDAAINGTADGLPNGVQDKSFSGFHRLEYGLWHGQSLRQLLQIANSRKQSVESLMSIFATAQLDPGQISIRAHEITENAIQFELTASTDYGSHSNLATVQANLAGTRVVLDLLKPLLLSRYPELPQTYAALARSQRTIAAVVGQSLAELPARRREDVNAALGSLVESLAPVAEICEPRRVS